MAGYGCTLSQQQRRHLRINTPRWRLVIILRSVTALIACLTIAAFAVCISVPIREILKTGGGSTSAWQWGDVWIESFAFVPPAVSLLQTLVTIPYLLSTTSLTHPAIELVLEFILVLIAAFPIVFCATVTGPLQEWQSGHSSYLTNNDELAGVTELIGFIGLCLLEILHFGFFVSACHRMHNRRRNKIAMARAAAMKLEVGWGLSEDEDAGLRSDSREPETRQDVQQPRPELKRRVDDIMAPPTPEELRRRAREENAQAERLVNGTRRPSSRRPSSVSALSSRGGRRSSSLGRRPSSLDGYIPQGRRRTEVSQIGIAIGKQHEVWVPINELRSESPLTPHRVVNDHEVVVVGEGEVKVVSTPREEVFMGWSMPEPARPAKAEVRRDMKGEKAMTSLDPDIPAPLRVRKSMKSFKLGNSWEMYDEQRQPAADQGW